MKKGYLYGAVLFFSMCYAYAQEVIPSNAIVNTSYIGKDYSLKESVASIFYNEVSKEIYVVVDFSKFKNELDSTNNWLIDIQDSRLVYKGDIKSENLLTLTSNNSKSVELNGKIKFNNVVVIKTIELILFEISKDGILYRNNNNDYYDRIRASVEISISPKDFNINKKSHHLTMPIFIRIENGYVNQFKPGMENWIGNNF